MISEITATVEPQRSAHHDEFGARTVRVHDHAAGPDGPRSRPPRRADARGATAAFAFAVLFVVGVLFVASTPDYAAADAEFEAWLEDGSNRAGQIIGVIALVLAGLCFLPLATAASARIRRRLDPVERTLDLVLAGVFATLATVGALVTGHGSIAVEIGDTPTPSADVVRSGEQIGYGIVLFAASLVAAWLVGRLALAAHRARSTPGWFVVLSAVTAVALVFGALFVPIVLLPIWAVALGVVLLRPAALGTRV